MGTTLSFNDIREYLGDHLRSDLSASLFFFFLSFFLQGCLLDGPDSIENRPINSNIPSTKMLEISDEMVWVPPGSFLMGTDEIDVHNEGLQLGFPQPWFEDEHPLFKVNLPGFYIDRTEVTQAAYLKFVRATGHRLPAHWNTGAYKVGTEDHPVTFVDWYDASDYCAWLGHRLPTEAEWEKAARGTKGMPYPWGNRFLIDQAYLSPVSDALSKTAPVGSYPQGASPYGALDMIGNVWEWTDSWYLPYPENPLRKFEFGMKHRVVRGLSFHSLGHYPGDAYPRVLEVYARASTRSYDPPSERLSDLGFRCAKSKESD